MDKQIVMTKWDHDRLKTLVLDNPLFKNGNKAGCRALEKELSQAVLVESTEIDPEVVTMNSLVRLKALDTGEVKDYTLVFPFAADFKRGLLSVLVPLGSALLGYRKGDIVEWKLPGIIRKFVIKKVLYQPEAAGDYRS